MAPLHRTVCKLCDGSKSSILRDHGSRPSPGRTNGMFSASAPSIPICDTLLRGDETTAVVQRILHVRRLVFVALSTIKLPD
jgi:hypothetical protein